MTRIIQIGMGRWGQDWAVRVFPEVPDAELVGCVDSRAEALSELVRLGVVDEDGCFETIEEAFEKRAAAAVLVTTDLPSHVAVVSQALEAGKHVLVEKPFAASLLAATETVGLAETLGLTLMVSQNYRFFPAVRAAQRLTRQGRLGMLLHIDLDFRRHAPATLKSLAGHHNWAQPLLLDMSIHHFDLLRAVIGSEPTSVYCRARNPGWAAFQEPPEGGAIIDFGDDVTVNYRGSWIHPGPSTLWAGEWRMEFEKGELWWTSRGDLHTGLQDEAWLYDHKAKRRPVELPRLARVDRAGALEAFVNAVRAGTEPESGGRENLGSLALAYAAVDSSLRRTPVQVPVVCPS